MMIWTLIYKYQQRTVQRMGLVTKTTDLAKAVALGQQKCASISPGCKYVSVEPFIEASEYWPDPLVRPDGITDLEQADELAKPALEPKARKASKAPAEAASV